MSKLSKKELHHIAETAVESSIQEKASAKEYLESIRRMEDSISRRKEEIERLRAEATGVTGISYETDRVQSSGGQDRMAKTVSRIVDMEREIMDDIENLSRTRMKIIRQIERLDSEEYCELLYKRYVRYESLETISQEMNYTYEYTRRMHGQALQAFERRYKKLHQTVVQ